MRRSRRLRWFLALAAAVVLLTLGVPAAHLIRTAIRDRDSLEPVPNGYADDASRLSATRVTEIWRVPASSKDAQAPLVALLARARRDGLPVSIAGARHTMGGHTIAPDGIVVDMLPYRSMSLSPDGRVLTVQAGALWSDVIPFLDRRGRSVAIMQSDSSFSVGGTLSVNAHGWQVRRPPIASSVESFHILLADGRILRCSRDENRQLFRLALGGYGLFGIILDADLRTVPNEGYEVERIPVSADRFAGVFHDRVGLDDSVEMAYGRLRVTRQHFLREGMLTVYRRTGRIPTPLATQRGSLDFFRRIVFRDSAGSDYGKGLRWNLETILGEKLDSRFATRNQLLDGDVSLYSNRTKGHTDILHEYFVPPNRLAAFLRAAREIVPRHEADLLNITLRDVLRDDDTVLRYADRNMIAVVMFFEQSSTAAGENDMRALTRKLIDASLAVDGRYYLPYRLHATDEQFLRAYPQAPELVRWKRTYDPAGRFRNQFYDRYLRRLENGPP